MTNILFHAHSGLRYLILLVGVVAVFYLAVGLATRRAYGSPARILTASFTGLLHLQVLIGLVLLVTGIYYPALIGHIFLMVLAAVAAQGLSIAAKRHSADRRKWALSFGGVLLALALIVAGITAIGRSPLGSSGRPTVAVPR
jgi:predicted permease